MKISIIFEAKKLKKEIEQIKKDLEYWRGLQSKQTKEHEEWCNRAYDQICAVIAPTSGFDCFDTAMMALLEEYIKIGGNKIDVSDYCFPRCPNNECRIPLSYYWDYCPRCGNRLIKKKE